MRILYFTRGWTAHDRRLVTAAGAAGHEVVLLRHDSCGVALPVETLPPGAREVLCPEPATNDLRGLVAHVQPDVLHAGPVPTCGYLAALTGFHPLVVMSWGSDLLWEAANDDNLRRQARKALDAADLFLCDCREVADAAAALSQRTAKRTTVFPWGIELERFAAAARDSKVRRQLG